MMKKLLVVLALVFAPVTASAADLSPVHVSPVPSPSLSYWSGLYLGASVGVASIKDTASDLDGWWDEQTFSQTRSGVIGGILAGYNWQSGALVYGIEGDISVSSAKGSINEFCSSSYCDYTQKVSLLGLGTARVRLGYDMGAFLPYITGGLAVGLVRNYVTDNNDEGLWDKTSFRAGYTLGGGLDYAVNRNWILRLEGLYYNLGNSTFASDSIQHVDSETYRFKFKNDGYVGRVAIAYKF